MIDLDIEGSPEICKNVLKLAKARYFTSTLIYNVQPNRFCQLGDPQGDGSGGACIYGLLSTLLADGELKNERVLLSQQRFLKSSMGRPLTREECQEKGRVVATEMKGIADTIGSQFLMTISEGKDMALDGFRSSDYSDDRQLFRSVGLVREDQDHVLDQIAAAYCDSGGRPYADIRIIRALVIDDPFDDPPGMDTLLKERGVILDEADDDFVVASPEYERPPEEKVDIRIQADQIDPLTGEEDVAKMREQEEEILKREDKSRAVVLEMLGDLPDAEATAPENVLFVCKLNPVTEDEDLELIFSRFDEKVKAEIIRDQDTGSSLQYAFVEFTTKQQAVEAYFKMNNALVDDRRIKVDFSQSVAKVWNKFSQRMRNPLGKQSNQHMPRDPFDSESKRPDGRNAGRPANNRKQGPPNDRPHLPQRHHGNNVPDHGKFDIPEEGRYLRDENTVDSFGRRRPLIRDGHDQGDERRPNRDQTHKIDRHHEGRRSRRHDSDSDSQGRQNGSRRQQRSRSRSNEKEHRKRSQRHHKSERKRRREDSSHDSDKERDSERRRHRKRDRHRGRGDSKERRGKSERKSAGQDDHDRDRNREHERHDEERKHHHDEDRRHGRRGRKKEYR